MADLNTVSYDQFVDIPSLGKKSKIIFSEEVYKYLKALLDETVRDNAEKGCYLVGRKSYNDDGALCFYFDFHSSGFQTANGNYTGGGVLPTDRSKTELIGELEKYHELGVDACIIHFHSHNLNGYFSSLSDQDYGVYASMKEQLKCEIFGMLGAPDISTRNETMEFSVVNCRDVKIVGTRACASFYQIPNIYHIEGNKIYRVGSFRKNVMLNKTGVTELTRPDRFVQNYREWAGSGEISGIGVNPNTGSMIVDTDDGYVDNRGSFNFPNENLTLEFPSIEQDVLSPSLAVV